MANTPNFGWETPDNTDLVKDGAAAMRTLGDAIDASLVDLKGGTSGQVLSKNSNTDMDFVWVTSDDANAIQNAIVDAKGDLISATAADTPARLAVGNNGETLVADSSATTGLRWQGNFAAGKNAIINGDFRINQRNFTSNTTNNSYNFDRWLQANSGGTVTVTPQTFTAGTAPVAGYEAINFVRIVTASQSAAGDYALYGQKIEDVRTFANQTVTVSFWAKAGSGTPNIGVTLDQFFGTAGSPTVSTSVAVKTITTSWARYSFTVNVPSVSGKAIGAGSALSLYIGLSTGSTLQTAGYAATGIQNGTFDIWGVQVEAGSVATAFQTATGTLAGELQAAQRYYWRQYADTNNTYMPFGNGVVTTSTNAYCFVSNPVPMRIAPATIDFSTLAFNNYGLTVYAVSTLTLTANRGGNLGQLVTIGSTGMTAGQGGWLTSNNSSSGYIGFSAEL